MNKIIIAIDGFSSCGKSTIAKALAQKLNYNFIDTGAMYRAVTVYALRNQLIVVNNNWKGLIEALPKIQITFRYNDKLQKSEIYLNGENVDEAIRTMEVNNNVSAISALKEVRLEMVALQREMGKEKGVVMDGRDIGTNVFPEAELKIFMTADMMVRAYRRLDEYKSKGIEHDINDVLKNIVKRDYEDMFRSENPLCVAKDAIIVDNSNMNKEEQLEHVLNLIKEKSLLQA
ncbi:MAG: (d)CMP kinase [Bacteroidia bacterium]